MGIDSLNICSLEDVSDILLPTDFANWLVDGLSFYLCTMGCHLVSDMVYNYHFLNQRCHQ